MTTNATNRRHRVRTGGLAALLLAVAACGTSGGAAHNSAAGKPSTGSSPSTSASPVTTQPTEHTPSSRPTAVPTPTMTASATGPANLVISPPTLDIADPGFDLIDSGGAPITFTIDGTDGALGLVPNAGRIAPGGYAIIRLDVNYLHDVYAEKATFNVHWNGQTTSIPVTGRYDTGPDLEDFMPPTVQMCPGRTGVVAVRVGDLEGIKSVTLNWIEKDSNGRAIFVGANPMSKIAGTGGPDNGQFQGTINRLPPDDPGPNGQLLWYVTAYDGGGKVSPDSSRHQIPLYQHC